MDFSEKTPFPKDPFSKPEYVYLYLLLEKFMRKGGDTTCIEFEFGDAQSCSCLCMCIDIQIQVCEGQKVPQSP